MRANCPDLSCAVLNFEIFRFLNNIVPSFPLSWLYLWARTFENRNISFSKCSAFTTRKFKLFILHPDGFFVTDKHQQTAAI